MPNDDPREATIDVHVLPGKTPNYRFESNSSVLQNGRLVFRNEYRPGFRIHFDIADSSGYRFAKSKDDALAAQKLDGSKGGCPKQGESWDEFVPMAVSNQGKRLTVRNYNYDKADFGFALFVTRDPNGDPPYEAIDPIGENKNGQRSLTTVVAVTVAVATAAITVAGLYALDLLNVGMN